MIHAKYVEMQTHTNIQTIFIPKYQKKLFWKQFMNYKMINIPYERSVLKYTIESERKMSIKWNEMKWNKNAMQLHFNRKLLLFCSFVLFFLSIQSHKKPKATIL